MLPDPRAGPKAFLRPAQIGMDFVAWILLWHGLAQIFGHRFLGGTDWHGPAQYIPAFPM